MFNFLNPYKYVIDAIVIMTLVGGIAFGVHKYNEHQQDIGEARVQAEWDKSVAVAKDAQRLREIQFQKEKDDAIIQAAKNVAVANAAAAAANNSSRVLDSTLKALIARSSTGSVEANRRYTSALAEVLGDCKDKYRELGRKAQGHADDTLKYDQAWPK